MALKQQSRKAKTRERKDSYLAKSAILGPQSKAEYRRRRTAEYMRQFREKTHLWFSGEHDKEMLDACTKALEELEAEMMRAISKQEETAIEVAQKEHADAKF